VSDEKPNDPIKYGDRIIVQEPPKASSGGRRGRLYGPALLALILTVGLLLIVFSPDDGSGTAASREVAPAASEYPCQQGIVLGGTATMRTDSVRLRKSPGYAGKRDEDVIKQLATGDQVTVESGPVREDGLCWWRVTHGLQAGWIADHSRTGSPLLSPDP
jgi:hypothetical protein